MPVDTLRCTFVTAALCAVGLAAAPSSVRDAQNPAARPVRVCAGGDVTMGTNLEPHPSPPGGPAPAELAQRLVPLFGGAEIALVNAEGAIGDGPSPSKCRTGSTNCYALRQPPGTELALRAILPGGAVVANVANNHAHDAGGPGFDETLRRLRAAGVLATGADTLATPVPVADGDTIGVLGFSPWSIAGVSDTVAVRRHVARAAGRFDRVIVTMHIGAEGPAARHTPDHAETFLGEMRGNSVAFARAAVAGGATLVIGHGPHVVRGIEWSGAALVAHSLGNLLTYGPFNVTGYNGRAAVLCATLEGDGSVSHAELRAVRQAAPGRTVADSAGRGSADARELTAADFPRTGAQFGAAGALSKHP